MSNFKKRMYGWRKKMDKNSQNIGDEIKDIIQNAITTMDFKKLNEDIGNTVNHALKEVKQAAKQANTTFNKSFRNGNPYIKTSPYTKSNNKEGSNIRHSSNTRETTGTSKKINTPTTINRRLPVNLNVGKVPGILYTVFGNIGVGILGVTIVVLAVVGSILNLQQMYSMIILGILPFLIISFFMTIRGAHLRNRIKRLKRYLEIAKGRNYCMIQELANRTGFRKRYIIKDLKKMFAKGMILEGYMDEKETCVMLDKEAYNLYLAAKNNSQLEQKEKGYQTEKVSQRETQKKEEKKEEQDGLVHAASITNNGEEYLNAISEARNSIHSEEVKGKLIRMEVVVEKIFLYIKKHPEQFDDISKFVDYYLPTTQKLLHAYVQFEHEAIQSETIEKAKKEIENTLDTINGAYEKLLGELYEDIVMDISTDISVLQIVLSQEGLTEREFSKK